MAAQGDEYAAQLQRRKSYYLLLVDQHKTLVKQHDKMREHAKYIRSYLPYANRRDVQEKEAMCMLKIDHLRLQIFEKHKQIQRVIDSQPWNVCSKCRLHVLAQQHEYQKHGYCTHGSPGCECDKDAEKCCGNAINEGEKTDAKYRHIFGDVSFRVFMLRL